MIRVRKITILQVLINNGFGQQWSTNQNYPVKDS